MCLDGESATCRGVTTAATETWEVAADTPGDLVWPTAPFDPYAEGNVADEVAWRPVLTCSWRGRIEFTFRAPAAPG